MSGRRARPLYVTFAAGNCPVVGLGSFGTLAFLGRKRVLCMGPPMPGAHPPVGALSHSLRQGKGVVRINRRLAGGPADGLRDAGLAGHGPAPLADVDLFSCQRAEARQTARLRRAAGARVYVETCGSVSRKTGIFG